MSLFIKCVQGRGPERLRHSHDPNGGLKPGPQALWGEPQGRYHCIACCSSSLCRPLFPEAFYLFFYLTLLQKAENATPPGKFTPTPLNPPQWVTLALTGSQSVLMTFAFCWLLKCGLGCGDPMGRWGLCSLQGGAGRLGWGPMLVQERQRRGSKVRGGGEGTNGWLNGEIFA